MKMINKAITKRRVKPVIQPIPADLAARPWNPDGAVVSGALVRSACISRWLTENAKPQRKRQKFPGWGAMSLYVEVPAFDERRWTFRYQMDLATAGFGPWHTPKWGWEMYLELSPNQEFEVGAGQWWEKDGELTAANFYDLLRDDLVDSVAVFGASHQDAEVKFSAASLRMPQPLGEGYRDRTQFEFGFVTTGLVPDSLRSVLNDAGQRQIASTPDGEFVGLGLECNSTSDFALLTQDSNGVVGTICIGSESGLHRWMAAVDAQQLMRSLSEVLCGRDNSAQYSGPEEWKP